MAPTACSSGTVGANGLLLTPATATPSVGTADGTLPSRHSPLEDPRSRTMTVLRSYVSGAWVSPAAGGHDDGRPVLDAVSGEEVARVSSAGIDFGAALAYGRSAGGPALRELTFHQRAV